MRHRDAALFRAAFPTDRNKVFRRGLGSMKQTDRVKIVRRIILVLLAVMLAGSGAVSAAELNFAYPTTTSKKGLYVTPGMEEDAIELGVRHATINLSVGDFMPSRGYRNSTHCVGFKYDGSTFWFAKNALERYDREMSRLAQNDVIVTAILLLPNRSDDLKNLIYPSARGTSANYYQWNMTDASAVRTLRAIVTFFQRRYSKKSTGRIVGWIVGNEVNNSRVWNWAGNISIDSYVDLYASQVAAVYSAARKVYANARIYMCLDHYWSVGNGSGWYAGKTILTKFAARAASKGLKRGTWNIAYHPYNISQYVVDIMSTSSSVTNSENTRIITMKNLNVLTNFVKKNYTKNCRVILSEQGYSSVTSGKDTSKEQARSIALAYYIAQQNSMVDSLILHRQVDHTGEGEKYGLYTSWGGENAAWKKLSWTAYKYADTTKKNVYTSYAAALAKQLSGLKVKKVVRVRSGILREGPARVWKKNYTNRITPYGAYAGFYYNGGTYTLKHDGGRNVNVPVGFIRTGRINCKTRKRLGFSILANGLNTGKAYVTLRLWSGAKRYFEGIRTISCGQWHHLYVNLKKWAYRKKITRVDIVVSSEGGGWAGDASISIRSIGTRK